MKNQQKQPSYADPLTAPRVAPFISDISRQGSELISDFSEKMNEISIRRSMQIGYMMACQDHGLPLPDFDDPAEEILKELTK